MNLRAVVAIMLCITGTAIGKDVPTPEMAMSFSTGEDSVKWVSQYMKGNRTGIIFEMVPEGQNIKAWKEMVAQQITFSNDSLKVHVDKWKKMILKSDPAVKIQEDPEKDGSILVVYKSKAFNEYSIRRFIHAKDGTYALAYHVRLDRMDENRIKLWTKIVSEAKLIPNPVKEKARRSVQ